MKQRFSDTKGVSGSFLLPIITMRVNEEGRGVRVEERERLVRDTFMLVSREISGNLDCSRCVGLT